jgi:hypothetical protein
MSVESGCSCTAHWTVLAMTALRLHDISFQELELFSLGYGDERRRRSVLVGLF